MRNGARLEPRAIAKAPEGEGCPKCGGFVYAAEQMLARGRVSFLGYILWLMSLMRKGNIGSVGGYLWFFETHILKFFVIIWMNDE